MVLQYLKKNLNTNVKFAFHSDADFPQPWHYHSELELVYIIEGEGTLYAGDFIGEFRKNDIVLLGHKMPHMFDNRSFKTLKTTYQAYVFHINKNFLPRMFTEFPEFNYLQNIVELSNKGALFRDPKNPKLLELLKTINPASNVEINLSLFRFLYQVSQYKSVKSLGRLQWDNFSHSNEKRIGKVISFILNNFQDSLELEQISKLSGMNKSAFCRHFKNSTGKSFIEFVNETRINYARKLLLDPSLNHNIGEICYKSGFNSLSYFNRTFKKYTGFGPSAYKKQKTKIAI